MSVRIVGHCAAAVFIDVNHGETLNAPGMLFVNRATWAHRVERVAEHPKMPRESLLDPEELAALDYRAAPEGRMI
jgi:hypothetical protein